MWASTPQRISLAISGKSAKSARLVITMRSGSTATVSTCVGQERSTSRTIQAWSAARGGRISISAASMPPARAMSCTMSKRAGSSTAGIGMDIAMPP